MFTMPRRHKQAVAIAVAIPFAAIIAAFSLGPAPEKALLEGGEAIVPIVIQEIGNKQMPKRKHAIEFLGQHHQRAALPALEAIVNDESELADFRADALEAISEIDANRGRELATMHAARSDHLGSSAKLLSN